MSAPHRRPILRDLRDALSAYGRSYEDGITASVFAIALLVLLGMVALGIDGGRIYDERRRAQNAADHAAIAAAFASCTSVSTNAATLLATAQTAGLASAAENGYDDNGTSNDVDIDVAPGYVAADHRYQARVDTTIGTTFARILGFSELDTNAVASAEASGCDETGANGSAVHAGGTSCPGSSTSIKTFTIAGNDNDVTGKTTTYGGFLIGGGNDNDFLNAGGPAVDYAGTWEVTGSNNTFVQPQQAVSVPASPWPAGWAPSDQTPALWAAYANAVATDGIANNDNINTDKFEIFENGIYYTEHTNGAVVEIKNTSVNSFTIVSRNGPITIGEPFNPTFGVRTFTAYPAPPGGKANALFITGDTDIKPCEVEAIKRSGEGGTWRGIWWAPNGLINVSGNLNHFGDPIARDGGLIAHAVHFRGGNNNRVYGGTGAPAAEPDVTLID